MPLSPKPTSKECFASCENDRRCQTQNMSKDVQISIPLYKRNLNDDIKCESYIQQEKERIVHAAKLEEIERNERLYHDQLTEKKKQDLLHLQSPVLLEENNYNSSNE